MFFGTPAPISSKPTQPCKFLCINSYLDMTRLTTNLPKDVFITNITALATTVASIEHHLGYWHDGNKEANMKNITMLLPEHVVQEAHRIAIKDLRFISNTRQQLAH